MKRREFLTRITIGGATLPLLFTEIGCGDDGGGPDGGVETFTSSSASGHTHTITIPDADIAGGGAHTYTSSNNSSHTHRVSFDESDVDYLAVGCAVIKESTEDNGHRHTWRVSYPDLASDITKTSNIDITSHTHQVTIPAADLSQPTGVHNYTTTSGGSGPHTHQVTLDQLQLIKLSECDTITAETTPDDTGHTHTFTLGRS
jgi:hypothetical protein